MSGINIPSYTSPTGQVLTNVFGTIQGNQFQYLIGANGQYLRIPVSVFINEAACNQGSQAFDMKQISVPISQLTISNGDIFASVYSYLINSVNNLPFASGTIVS